MDEIINNIINNLTENAEKNNPRNPEDYIGENGLLYCGKCNTPKQCKFKALGEEKIVFCLCDCKKREQEKEKQAEKEAKMVFRRQQIREAAFPDRDTRQFTFDVDDRNNAQASDLSRGYAASFDPKASKGLLFYGDCGTGKSFYAACIVNAVIDRNYTAKFTSISEIEAELWAANDKKAVYDYFNGFDLLVLDDFSAERDTRYMQEIVFNVIDRHSKSNKPIIVTTNLTPNEISNSTNIAQKRSLSRILGNCTSYLIKGADRRIDMHKRSNAQELEKILNYPLPENLK